MNKKFNIIIAIAAVLTLGSVSSLVSNLINNAAGTNAAAPASTEARSESIKTGLTANDIRRISINNGSASVKLVADDVDEITLDLIDLTTNCDFSESVGELRIDCGHFNGTRTNTQAGGIIVRLPKELTLNRLNVATSFGDIELFDVDSEHTQIDSSFGNVNVALKDSDDGYNISAETTHAGITVDGIPQHGNKLGSHHRSGVRFNSHTGFRTMLINSENGDIVLNHKA